MYRDSSRYSLTKEEKAYLADNYGNIITRHKFVISDIGPAIEFRLAIESQDGYKHELICSPLRIDSRHHEIEFNIIEDTSCKVTVPVGKHAENQHMALGCHISKAFKDDFKWCWVPCCYLAFVLIRIARRILDGEHLPFKNTRGMPYHRLNRLLRQGSNNILFKLDRRTKDSLNHLLKNKKPDSFVMLFELQRCLDPRGRANFFAREHIPFLLDYANKIALTQGQTPVPMITKNVLENYKIKDKQRLCAILLPEIVDKPAYLTYCYINREKLILGYYKEPKFDNDFFPYDLLRIIQTFLGSDYNPGNISRRNHKMLKCHTQKPILAERNLQKMISCGLDPNDMAKPDMLINDIQQELKKSRHIKQNYSEIVDAIKVLKVEVLDNNMLPVAPSKFKQLLAQKLKSCELMVCGFYRQEYNTSNTHPLHTGLKNLIIAFFVSKTMGGTLFGYSENTRKYINQSIDDICGCYKGLTGRVISRCAERLGSGGISEVRNSHSQHKQAYDRITQIMKEFIMSYERPILKNNSDLTSSDKLKVKFIIKCHSKGIKSSSMQHILYKKLWLALGKNNTVGNKNNDDFINSLIKQYGDGYNILLKVFNQLPEAAITIIDDTLDKLNVAIYLENLYSKPNSNKTAISTQLLTIANQQITAPYTYTGKYDKRVELMSDVECICKMMNSIAKCNEAGNIFSGPSFLPSKKRAKVSISEQFSDLFKMGAIGNIHSDGRINPPAFYKKAVKQKIDEDLSLSKEEKLTKIKAWHDNIDKYSDSVFNNLINFCYYINYVGYIIKDGEVTKFLQSIRYFCVSEEDSTVDISKVNTWNNSKEVDLDWRKPDKNGTAASPNKFKPLQAGNNRKRHIEKFMLSKKVAKFMEKRTASGRGQTINVQLPGLKPNAYSQYNGVPTGIREAIKAMQDAIIENNEAFNSFKAAFIQKLQAYKDRITKKQKSYWRVDSGRFTRSLMTEHVYNNPKGFIDTIDGREYYDPRATFPSPEKW